MQQDKKTKEENEFEFEENIKELDQVKSNRPRLRSILKTQNDQLTIDDNAQKQKRKKSVQFADDYEQVYKVASYKKYNTENLHVKKKCCLCIIF